MRDVMVLGVGVHPFGRFEDKSYEDLGQIAVKAALEDAGDMPWTQVQSAFCGTMHGGTGAGHRVLARVGMTGIPIVNVETGLTVKASQVTGKEKELLKLIVKLSKKILEDLDVRMTKAEEDLFDRSETFNMESVVLFSKDWNWRMVDY